MRIFCIQKFEGELCCVHYLLNASCTLSLPTSLSIKDIVDIFFKIMIFQSLSVLEHTTQQHPYLKHCCSTQAHQVLLIQSFRQLLLHYTTKCINKAIYYMSVDINIWVLQLDNCLEAQSNKNYTFFFFNFRVQLLANNHCMELSF